MSEAADAGRVRETGEPAQPPALERLPSHYPRCFGCGRDHPTGLGIEIRGRDLHVEGSFTVTEHHQGAPGLAHGGVIAAAVDETMGYLLWLLETLAVTAHLEVDYRRPVPVGSTLRLEADVERTEGRKIFATMTGTIDGEIAVRGRALFLRVGLRHFQPYLPAETPERPTYNP